MSLFFQSQIFMQLTRTSKSRFLNLNSWLLFICTKEIVCIWPSRGHISFLCGYLSCFVSCFGDRYGHTTSLLFFCTFVPSFRKERQLEQKPNKLKSTKRKERTVLKAVCTQVAKELYQQNVVKYVNKIWEDFFYSLWHR